MKVKRIGLTILIATTLSQTVAPSTVAKEEQINVLEQIEKLERIAQVVNLEAEIAKKQAKKEKARAEIAKARAKRAWSKVNRLEAEMKLRKLQTMAASGDSDSQAAPKK